MTISGEKSSPPVFHGGPQGLGELPSRALELADLGLDGALGGARGLDGLLALHLGFLDHELGLAPGIVLHLLDHPLGGDEGLLEHALALLEAAGALLGRLEVLLEQRVLLQHGLVVARQILEERVHFLDVEATEHSHRELLLPDIHGGDAHGGLLSAAPEGAGAEGPTPPVGWRR